MLIAGVASNALIFCGKHVYLMASPIKRTREHNKATNSSVFVTSIAVLACMRCTKSRTFILLQLLYRHCVRIFLKNRATWIEVRVVSGTNGSNLDEVYFAFLRPYSRLQPLSTIYESVAAPPPATLKLVYL
jgi:hypothetical protein